MIVGEQGWQVFDPTGWGCWRLLLSACARCEFDVCWQAIRGRTGLSGFASGIVCLLTTTSMGWSPAQAGVTNSVDVSKFGDLANHVFSFEEGGHTQQQQQEGAPSQQQQAEPASPPSGADKDDGWGTLDGVPAALEPVPAPLREQQQEEEDEAALLRTQLGTVRAVRRGCFGLWAEVGRGGCVRDAWGDIASQADTDPRWWGGHSSNPLASTPRARACYTWRQTVRTPYHLLPRNPPYAFAETSQPVSSNARMHA